MVMDRMAFMHKVMAVKVATAEMPRITSIQRAVKQALRVARVISA
jgi:hypothetical protein